MPIAPDEFRAALSRFASGVTVVTTRSADGRDLGMTATSFASVSLAPPLILVCVDHAATMRDPLATAEHFAVHVLAADQEEVSRAFARREATDKFDGRRVQRGSGSVPLLDRALARLECRVWARHQAGDHDIIIGEVLAAALGGDADPLLYFRGRYRHLTP